MVDAATLPLLPVEKAPVVRRGKYGPCLVTPGPHGRQWAVAFKEDGEWFTEDGNDQIEPRRFMILGAPP